MALPSTGDISFSHLFGEFKFVSLAYFYKNSTGWQALGSVNDSPRLWSCTTSDVLVPGLGNLTGRWIRWLYTNQCFKIISWVKNPNNSETITVTVTQGLTLSNFLPSTGPWGQIGVGPDSPQTMNSFYAGGLSVPAFTGYSIPANGPIGLAQFRGTQARWFFYLSSDFQELNLRQWLINNGWDSQSPHPITVYQNQGYIFSDNTAAPALTIDGLLPNLTLELWGTVMGKGGRGGNGDLTFNPATAGGVAIRATNVAGNLMRINVNSTGQLLGGGGGGASSGATGGGGGAGGGQGGWARSNLSPPLVSGGSPGGIAAMGTDGGQLYIAATNAFFGAGGGGGRQRVPAVGNVAPGGATGDINNTAGRGGGIGGGGGSRTFAGQLYLGSPGGNGVVSYTYPPDSGTGGGGGNYGGSGSGARNDIFVVPGGAGGSAVSRTGTVTVVNYGGRIFGTIVDV